ncbi:MAG: hypothetical protein JXR39_08765 [Marinilabiliaceae bacterium]|nr:hypothetical protein [Marinilabiliaceae bacterium]
MINIEDSLNIALRQARDVFNRKDLFKVIEIPDFDCSLLSNPYETDGGDLPDIIKDSFFKYLHQYDYLGEKVNDFPCLYVFRLQNTSDYERVIEAIKAVKSEDIDRVLPPFKTNIPYSQYLYVGKVNRDVGGRLVTHLGYYQTNSNHGLQLAFWARNMKPSLFLSVSVYRFGREMTPYISSFENILAHKLQPLIGKHK